MDHFDLLASLYDRMMPPSDPERLRAVLGLPTAGWLLDMGGGTGRASAPLRAWVGGLVVSDLSVPMLRAARAKGGLASVQARAEQLPFADASLARVLVVDALHHFRDQRAALAELLRVLRPGGRLVIEEPDITRFRVKLIALAEKVTLMRSRFYTPEAIGELIAALSFHARIERQGATAWVIVEK